MIKEKQKAFMSAYQPHHEAFMRYCSALAYGKMDVEDLVQDVLVGAYEKFDKIEKKEKLLHYLIRAARNRSISLWRKNHRITELKALHTDRLADKGVSPEVTLDIQFLYQKINQLPAKQRDALILFEICGFSMKEIAQIQNNSEGAIKTKISRARKKLREMMREKVVPSLMLWIMGKRKDDLVDFGGEDFESELFELARNIPTEISAEKVVDLITNIPYIPLSPVQELLTQINLNTVVLGSASIASIIGGVVLISTPVNQDQLSGLSTTIDIPEVTNITQKAEQEVTQEEILPYEVDEMPNPEVVLMSLGSQAASEKEELNELPQAQEPRMETMSLLPKLDLPSMAKDLFSKKTNLPKAFPSLTSNLPEGQCNDCKTEVENPNGLKAKLLYHLSNDKLIKSKKEINRLSFAYNEVLINRRWIPSDLQQKYLNILKRHDIQPGSNKLIELAPKYIAVGYVTKREGFKGNISGSIDLSYLEKIRPQELRPLGKYPEQNQVRPISPFHTLQISGLAVVYLSEGPTTNAKVSVSGMPIEDLITKEDNGVLTITTDGNYSGEKIRVEISATNLKKIVVAGTAELRTETVIKAEDLEIVTADVGAAWMEVDVKDLSIFMMGGDLSISGYAMSKEVDWSDEDAQRGTLRHKQLKVAQ